MAQQQAIDWVKAADQMKEAGLTCEVLKDKIKSNIEDVKAFRSFGFIKLAEQEQGVVDKLKVIDSRACLLE